MHEQGNSNHRFEALAFFGGIVAGQSHEVTNVLTIINELAGLQQDLLRAASGVKGIDLEKLEKVNGKIRNQVRRGEEILGNLKRFAHSTDAPLSLFEVRESLGRIVALAERSMRLRKIALIAEFPEKSPVIESDPFAFQHAVWLGIEAASLSVGDARCVRVGYLVHEEGVEITVRSDDPPVRNEVLEGKMEALGAFLRDLGGGVTAPPWEGDKNRLVFWIPRGSRGPEEASGHSSEDRS